MSDPKPQQEPSMEEILASIRRIIAEDEKPADPPPLNETPAAEAAKEEVAKEEVLELTEIVGGDGIVEAAAHDGHNSHAESGAPDSRGEPPPRHLGEKIEAREEAAAPPLSAGTANRILSNATSGAAAAAFARLASVPRERRGMGDIPLGAGDRTLEDIVREALRPLLQAWLDDNLPDLVERLVRAEIALVVGEAGLR